MLDVQSLVKDQKAYFNTAKRIVSGKFINAGQTCIAPDYLLVHQERKTQLLEQMVSSTIIYPP